MPHHTSADLETIFDPELGEGTTATITPPAVAAYSANVIVSKDFQRYEEGSGVAEKVTVVQILTADQHADPLPRGTTVDTDDGEYTIEQQINQDTYVSTYSVSC